MNQKDIAKLAGLSSATVSRVINDDPLVKAATKKKVLEIVNEYGYIPNSAARSLKTSRTNIIGYLVPDIRNPFFTAVLAGFEDLCYKEGYDIIFQNTNENAMKEKQAVQTLLRYRVDGVLAVFTDAKTKEFQYFEDRQIPIVCVDRKVVGSSKTDCILTDNYGGMYQLVKHLVSLGHRDIALIMGTPGLTPGEERNKGFEEAMAKFDMKIKPEYLVQGFFTEEGAYSAAQKLLSLKDRPTAIVAPNNFSTMGAYRALRDEGLSIGKDISLAGFDDFPLAGHLTPPVTVIKRPNTEIGKIAAERLLARIDAARKGVTIEPREMRLPVELCIRESCTALR